jgi:hypothetical protein
MRPHRLFAALAGLAVAVLAVDASAASIIRDPNPPKYKVEIEPKLNLSYLGLWNYGGNAWGPGVRFTIPVMSPGFIKTINDSIGISFGLDMLKYSGYYDNYYYGYCAGNPRNCPGYAYDPSFWAVHIPVTLQWNFWLTDSWSVFGEPGLTIRHAWYHEYPNYAGCDPRFYQCSYDRSTTDVFFTFFAGGRYHFSDTLALTMRLGYPIDFSIGLSIFL